MSRLSIEISGQQHQQIKAMAALNGMSIKDYILEATVVQGMHNRSPDTSDYTADEKAALAELTAFMKPRIEAARRGEFSDRSIEDIIADARKRKRSH